MPLLLLIPLLLIPPVRFKVPVLTKELFVSLKSEALLVKVPEWVMLAVIKALLYKVPLLVNLPWVMVAFDVTVSVAAMFVVSA